MEGADNAALDDRPEAIDRVGVYGTNHVFLRGMVNGGARIALLAEATIVNGLCRAS
jgi:hypothetical protein